MKKNLLALTALVLTIVVSAFTMKPNVIVYADYDQINAENAKTSYTMLSSQPAHEFTNPLIPKLNWFRVDAGSDGVVSDTEFSTAFEFYDVQVDASNLLKDESADITGQLDLFNK
jgi:hypothetical protein